MIDLGDILGHIDDHLDEATSLGVARIGADGVVTGAKLNLSTDAADAFREHCRSTRDGIAASTPVPYRAAPSSPTERSS